jgi:hypothetical protein
MSNVTGTWLRRAGPSPRRSRHAGQRALVILELTTGTAALIFEAAELAWIGFQPLEAVFALVGVAVIGLAGRQSGRRT